MTRRTWWLLWGALNLLLLVGVPAYVGWDADRAIAEEFRFGLRSGTDGDTVTIPIMEAFISMALLMLVMHVLLLGYWLVRRRHSRPAA